MKFGKEFASQMIPKWREAYMNYSFLKTPLKEILYFRQESVAGCLKALAISRINAISIYPPVRDPPALLLPHSSFPSSYKL